MKAHVKAIAYHLPQTRLTTEDLSAHFPEWSVDKIREKTGIDVRFVAGDQECASDLGVAAAQKLFASTACGPEEVDFLIFCTQSPDHALPATACTVQERLDIPRTAGAMDMGLGCSGYVYGLGAAKGLIETGQARNVLLLTAETYSKYMHPEDKRVQTIFSDGASATMISGLNEDEVPGALRDPIGPFVYGTDGRGAANLIVRRNGLRQDGPPSTSRNGQQEPPDGCLFMNGPEIFKFTLREIPRTVNELLGKARIAFADVDLFVFHQANIYILERLRQAIQIPEDKFYLCLSHVGNTVSSTIPIALASARAEGRLTAGSTVMLVGFGVGYSWGACLLRMP